MKKILFIILSITMLFSTATAAFVDGVDGPIQKAKIKVATSADFNPFEYYDENGELTGFDIDLMNYIGERIGFDIEFVDMSFDKLIPAVVNGEVACAISAITVTEERDSIIDYSREYLKTHKITFDENGKRSTKFGEEYAIVFREGLAGSPYEDLEEPIGDETLYILIDKALSELSNDRTVMKLIEKYELNKPLDESTVNVEYSAIMSGGDPGAKTEDSEPKTSATSVPASEWAWADVDKAKALNIINHGGNYNFPGAITREKFCELAYNYVSEFGELPADSGHVVFTDTDNKKVRILNTMGIIKGKSATQFAPNDLLTREEAATILERLINVVHPGLGTDAQYITFADSADISDWAMSSIQTICKLGIMQGVGNNNFAPQENYTTEQAVVTLVRVYANSGAGKNTFGGTTDSYDSSTFADKLNLLMPSDKNYMFSPMSIKMAFAMAANGAEGNTKAQILNALDIDNIDEYNTYAKKMIADYQKADILKLDIANAVWLNKSNTSQSFVPEFKNKLQTYYDAEVRSSTKDVIADEINSWVKNKTNGKINEIIKKEFAQDSRFIMALLNAVYFKAAWQNEFNEKYTQEDIFTDRNGNEQKTDFMNKTSHYKYYKDDEIEVLSLPYKNRVYDEAAQKTIDYDFDISMYAIRGACSENKLSELIENNKLTSQRISLSIPKFESEFNTSLSDIMNKIGVTDAFIPGKANFGKMFNAENVYLMDAFHKTYIKVDEKGTEAAAVTALAVGATSVQAPPEVVKFNTPFTYVIRDNVSGEILFMGEYAFVE